MRKLQPRPIGVTAAGYFLVGVAFFGLLRATLLVNDVLHEAEPNLTVPYLFPFPMVAGFCAWFIFRGHNWARILFWVVAGPLAIYGLFAQSELKVLLMNVLYTMVYFTAGGMLATRNSHWFFTGRDYRRRPVAVPGAPHRAAPQPGGERERRKFEY